ncbi:hypothetical protein MG5_04627 [Candida albicans P57072]|nr:hypothetical protein MG5_04627 [Candida albicans P57072]KGU25033.1 hypothetical protein MGM_04638 [Candida albicans P75063]KHC32062.1 hypothetical protein MGO_04594 [Candida albicans P76055]KHC32742.1 hypothetical protein MGQ_04604 [Candida albicans P76067]KHC64079.1 hypothetical protein MGI_04595 [Candida albicans P75016]
MVCLSVLSIDIILILLSIQFQFRILWVTKNKKR